GRCGGGQMVREAEGARRGIEDEIAKLLKMEPVAAAQAIVEIAIAKMSLAVREVSVEKGFDPRDFALVASGGAGPLHVLAIARELHIPKVIVPLFPSHFSALGMLLADERHDFIRTHYADLAAVDFAELVRIHDEMAAAAAAGLRHAAGAQHQAHLDLRYVGQEFTLSVPVTRDQLVTGDRSALRAAFDALYDQRYAHHSPDEPVEMVNLRLALVGKRAPLAFPTVANRGPPRPRRTPEVFLDDPPQPVACPVLWRADLGAGCRIAGPALIQEHGTTTVLFAGDGLDMHASGEMVITVRSAQ